MTPSKVKASVRRVQTVRHWYHPSYCSQLYFRTLYAQNISIEGTCPGNQSFAKKLEKMEHTIERAKSCEVGCSNVERKLRQLLDITEDEAYLHTRQSAFLYHLGVQAIYFRPFTFPSA